jgi:hypothetical protein
LATRPTPSSIRWHTHIETITTLSTSTSRSKSIVLAETEAFIIPLCWHTQVTGSRGQGQIGSSEMGIQYSRTGYLHPCSKTPRIVCPVEPIPSPIPPAPLDRLVSCLAVCTLPPFKLHLQRPVPAHAYTYSPTPRRGSASPLSAADLGGVHD